jgi:type IV pilus assembly protein PilX
MSRRRPQAVPVAPRRRQRGAVLYLALLLLLLVTVLAIGGAVSASLELQMAGNVRHRERALAAAEFAVGEALASGAIDTGSTLRDPARPACGDACRTPGTGDPWTYAAWYDDSAGGTPAPDGGHSLGAGIEAHHFVIEAAGESGRGARSEVAQGYYLLGPAED